MVFPHPVRVSVLVKRFQAKREAVRRGKRRKINTLEGERDDNRKP